MANKFHTTSSAAEDTGYSRASIWRACSKHPGFAIRLGGQYRIPDEHIRRVKAGESVSAIAAQARAGGANRAA